MLKPLDKHRRESSAFRSQRRDEFFLEKRGLERSTCCDLRTLVDSFRGGKKDEAYNALCQLCIHLSENPIATSAKFLAIPNSVHSLVGLLTKSSGDGRLLIKAFDFLVSLSLGGSAVCLSIAKLAGPYTLNWTSCELLHIVWRTVVLVGNLACDTDSRVAKLLVKQGVLSQVASLLQHYDEQIVEAAFRAILSFLNSGIVDVNRFARDGRVLDAIHYALLQPVSKVRRCFAAFIYFHLLCSEYSLVSCHLLESLLRLVEQSCEMHDLFEVGLMLAVLRIFGTSFCIRSADDVSFSADLRLRFLLFCKHLVASNIPALQKETLWALCNFTSLTVDHCMDLLKFEESSFLLDTLSTTANRPLDVDCGVLYFHIASNVSLSTHCQNENGVFATKDNFSWTAADVPGWTVMKRQLQENFSPISYFIDGHEPLTGGDQLITSELIPLTSYSKSHTRKERNYLKA